MQNMVKTKRNIVLIWKWRIINFKKLVLKILKIIGVVISDIDFDNILLDEKSYQNTLIYDISYKIFIGAKPLCIIFNKVDGFVKVYDETGYLALFGPEKYDSIYEVVHLTLLSHIFSIQVRFGACDVTGQWGRLQNKRK